jgi:broad specificity phosphatase PhoE
LTLCLLVRHAAHDLVDRVLVGRMDGISLSGAGRRQAVALGTRLKSFNVTGVQSSPRRRAADTAAVIAKSLGLDVEIRSALDELEFGAWTGSKFEDLAGDPQWACWNRERGRTRPPGGESMHEAQTRIVSHLNRMRETPSHGCIVMVSHAEVIRAAVLHAMSMPLDEWMRVDVPPASVTKLELRPRANGFDVTPGTMSA